MTINTAHSATRLTPEDLTFLRRPLQGFLTVADGPVPPQPRPVWFEATDAPAIQLFTDPKAPKVRALHRDPRASIVVASPVGEREHWVSITGSVTMTEDGADELLERLAARYWDLRDPARADELDGMRAAGWLRVIIEPESVRRVAP